MKIVTWMRYSTLICFSIAMTPYPLCETNSLISGVEGPVNY